jgi:hypothetical protein
MIKAALWNVWVAVGVALPIGLLSVIGFSAVFPPSWVGEGGRVWTSVGDAAGGFLFWYLSLAPLVLGATIAHQILLALLPRHWFGVRARAAVAGTAAVGCLLLVYYQYVRSSEMYWLAVVALTLPGLAVYSLLANPFFSAVERSVRSPFRGGAA